MAKCSNTTLALLSVLLLQTAILIHVYMYAVFPFNKDVLTVKRETALLLNAYDTNGDGVIDLWEFEALQLRISETEARLYKKQERLISEDDDDDGRDFKVKEIKNDERVLHIKSEFSALVLDSMSKFQEDQVTEADMQAFTGLRNWQKAAKEEARFLVEDFNIFLPKRNNLALGEAWTFVAPETSQHGPSPPNDRYTSPNVNSNHLVLHNLLRMFHPRPFLYSRFPPQEAVACIRAKSENFLEIEFRVHAEFQINTPPQLPFWFTPSQFSGRIIISKDGKHIEYFTMEVPSNQSLNIDMEWLTGRAENNEDSIGDVQHDELINMEVDIGYLPKMKLESITPSNYHGANHSSAPEDIEWKEQISSEEARNILEKKLYPFKQVPYLSFDNAYKKAKEEQKLVHSILLWGALDDQSC